MHDDDEILTRDQFAAMVGVSAETADKWRITGRGPKFLRLTKRSIRYRRSDVVAWLAECAAEPAA